MVHNAASTYLTDLTRIAAALVTSFTCMSSRKCRVDLMRQPTTKNVIATLSGAAKLMTHPNIAQTIRSLHDG